MLKIVYYFYHKEGRGENPSATNIADNIIDITQSIIPAIMAITIPLSNKQKKGIKEIVGFFKLSFLRF